MGHTTGDSAKQGGKPEDVSVLIDLETWRRARAAGRARGVAGGAADRLGDRSLALLRAVALGRAELTCSRVPDLFIDGLCCCNQDVARELVRAGLIHQSRPGRIDQRVRAVLTARGRTMLDLASELLSA